MNKLKVECCSEELMVMADKEFSVVTHNPEEDSRKDYSGEFIIMDSRPEDDIIDKVKDLHDNISNKIV